MYNRSEGVPSSSIQQVIDLTSVHASNRVSLGMALHHVGISLEMLSADVSAQFELLAELDDEQGRMLQWWLDDFENTGISIL
jgi:hypothetical protein